MTNPITPDQIRKAKEWAEYVTRPAHMWSITPAARAAAEVIQSLPDEIVDGDKVREVINAQLGSHPHGTVGHQVAEGLACKMQALLPAPAPRAEIALGNWAMHPEHGKVLICSTHADEDAGVRVAVADPPEEALSGFWDAWVSAADLSPVPSSEPEGVNGPFPDTEGMTTQDPHTGEWEPYRHILNTPEPQPGECWLIDVAGTEYSAVRNFSEAGCEWSANDDDGGYLFDSSEVRLIRRLVPEQQSRVLSTLSDYENAPTGTIVAQAGASPYVLTRNGMWGNRHRHEMNHPQASEGSRTVLRWGWGERA